MNKKIDNYIDVLFSDIPRSKKASELKEELRANMNEHYDDCIAQGQTESQAYGQTVASLGDVDEMLASVTPDAEFKREAQRYRTRHARNIGVAVGLYILGAALVVGSAIFQSETAPIIAVSILLMLAAVATGLIIYTDMSTPREYKDFNRADNDDTGGFDPQSPEGRKFKNIMSLYWLVITATYLLWSFVTFEWGTTWIIWPIAGVLSGIIRVLFNLRYDKNE